MLDGAVLGRGVVLGDHDHQSGQDQANEGCVEQRHCIFAHHLLADEEGLDKLAHLVRSYFKMDGHHVQFNVVSADTLRDAQKHPEMYRDLIVRVAGYSDYFVDLCVELQDEIIKRTEHLQF